MKKIVLFTLLAGACSSSYGQSAFSEFTDNPSAFTLSSEKNTLQIGGRISFYAEDRFLKPQYDNLSHNGIDVKDMDIDMIGKTASKFAYEVHYSLVDIITAAATGNTNNSANPGFKAAYIQYDGFSWIKIKMGYDKIPFSQSNISHEHETPFWGHPNLTGGDLFSRRDIGLTLNSSFWRSRINIYGGMYSGMGENFFEYGQDQSGKFEYVGRVEFSYPSKMSYSEIDEENSPIVHFRVAGNIRYEDKNEPDGNSVSLLYPDAIGAYGTRIVNGYRTVYGGDAIIKYRGISATFEDDLVNMRPSNPGDALYNGTAPSLNKGVVNAGGIIADLNYNWQKIRSVFSVGYENTNVNDLVQGHMEAFTFAYAYKFNSFNSCAKIEYTAPTLEDKISDPLKWKGQLKIGYQIVF